MAGAAPPPRWAWALLAFFRVNSWKPFQNASTKCTHPKQNSRSERSAAAAGATWSFSCRTVTS